MLTFTPNKPAEYPCYLLFKSADETDIRLYDIRYKVSPQTIKAQLEFRVPARGTVSQEIPIINNTDKDWQVRATLSIDNHDAKLGGFSMATKDLKVTKKTSG